MARYFIHFAIWLVGAPWLACSMWYWWVGFMRSPDVGFEALLMSLFIAALGGLYGVLVCLVITFPLSVLVCVLFGFMPKVSGGRSFHIWFPVGTSLVGLLWAQTIGRSLGTGRTEYALLVVGFLAGLTLGVCTLRLWRARSNQQRMEARA